MRGESGVNTRCAPKKYATRRITCVVQLGIYFKSVVSAYSTTRPWRLVCAKTPAPEKYSTAPAGITTQPRKSLVFGSIGTIHRVRKRERRGPERARWRGWTGGGTERKNECGTPLLEAPQQRQLKTNIFIRARVVFHHWGDYFRRDSETVLRALSMGTFLKEGKIVTQYGRRG
jgi:hypothetical protein